MKKLLFYSLMTTTTLLSPIFAFPGWAKDCPEIPKDTKVITVKSNTASLRTEAKQSSPKPDLLIYENNSLNVISPSPVKDLASQDFCWYKVSAVNDKDNKPYFIADVGIKEFPFSNLSMGDKPDASGAKNTGNTATSGQHSSSPPPTNNKGTSEQNGVAQEKLPQDVSQQKWLTFVVIGISIGNIVILLLICLEVSKVRKYLNIPGLFRPKVKPSKLGYFTIDELVEELIEISVAENSKAGKLQDSDELLSSIKRGLNRIEISIGSESPKTLPINTNATLTIKNLLLNMANKLDIFLGQLKSIETTNQSTQNDIKFITRRVESLEGNQQHTDISSSGNQETPLTPDSDNDDISQSYNQHKEVEYQIPETPSSSVQESNYPSEDDQNPSQITHTPITISPQLQEIIDRFNQQRPELFNDFPSQPLTLTQQAIQGKVGPGGRRILQLEIPADTSQDTYLRFEMDNSSWLIPNITSRYISKIMGHLGENSDIFTIRGGSGSSLQLVKPAKLKVSTDNPQLWEIEEPGEFQ